MADSASELDLESDTSSFDGVKEVLTTNEQALRRIESLQQENRVLKTEQAKAEQEEEYISNTLLKKITELKKEKESLALNYEQEEECLTNELNRKFTQLKQDKVALEKTLAREQENQVDKLMRRIEKLEADMNNKQNCLDKLRREKIELENALEQEQEALVNKLWKKMEKLEAEKKMLQEKLESVGAPLPVQSDSQPTNMNSLNGRSYFLPTNSGPTNLRGSFKCTQASSISTPFVVTTKVVPTLLNLAVLPTKMTEDSKSTPIDQSSPIPIELGEPKIGALTVPNESHVSKYFPFPQSPMDVDVLYSNVSGAHSPCGSVGISSLPTTPNNNYNNNNNNLYSNRNPSTSCNMLKNHTAESVQAVSASYVDRLRNEVSRLRHLLSSHEAESATKMPQIESEEKTVAEENRRLRKLLQIEKERREVLCRQLSESESSLEMEDERQFNEASRTTRFRTISDCMSQLQHPGSWTINVNSPSSLYGPGHAFAAAIAAGSTNVQSAGSSSGGRSCRECGQSSSSAAQHHHYISESMSTGCHHHHHHPDLGLSPHSNHTRSYSGCYCCSPLTSTAQQQLTPNSSIGGGGVVEPFLKPTSQPHTSVSASHINQYYFNTVPSNIGNADGCKESVTSTDLYDADEEDDLRCATPPSGQLEKCFTST